MCFKIKNMFEDFVKKAKENPKDIDKIFSEFLKKVDTVSVGYKTKVSAISEFAGSLSNVEFNYLNSEI